MVERSFEESGVTTDSTKFGYILGALYPRYAAEVRDIIVNPPPIDPYGRLKSELIRRLSLSQEQKTRRLLEHKEFGDRKPSQFLRHLRELGGAVIPDTVLRTLWVGRLPTAMQLVLATQRDIDLDKVAELADAIAETSTPRAHVAEVSLSAGNNVVALLNTKMAQLAVSLREEISAIRQEIVSNSRPSRRGRELRPRSPDRVRARTLSTSRHGKRGMCWYHWKFDSGAHKCIIPCTYNAGNDQGGR
ncbi:uncharacterized protein LOC143367207 [Andrena cerasifolii]|uniref:uncharacterized protein LOC143367207 n=1 Tax=Andrena cerasifolii TaxID=2819439 RepID=UPI0040380ACC